MVDLLGVGIGLLHNHVAEFLQAVELDARGLYLLLCFICSPFRVSNLTLLASYFGPLQGSLSGLESHIGALIVTIGGVPIVVYLILLTGTIFGRLGISLDEIREGVLLHIANQAEIGL